MPLEKTEKVGNIPETTAEAHLLDRKFLTAQEIRSHFEAPGIDGLDDGLPRLSAVEGTERRAVHAYMTCYDVNADVAVVVATDEDINTP